MTVPGLRAGLRVVVQARRATAFSCYGFEGLAGTSPFLVSIIASPIGLADADVTGIADAIRRTLSTYGPEIARSNMPCSGNAGGGFLCHAHRVDACTKVLVVVAKRGVPFPDEPLINDWLVGGANYRIIPLLEEGADARESIPPSVRHLNAALWTRSTAECVDEVLALAGFAPEDRRVFVSYRRDDSLEIAEQLFEELPKHRFDVFVDRFRINPGLDFQERLTDELSNKSMVLVLESPTLPQSPWIAYELATAATLQLGRLAVHLPGATPLPALTDDFRVFVEAADLLPNGARGASVTKGDRLEPAKLNEVIDRLVAEHARAMIRRRQSLLDAFRAALMKHGGPTPGVDPRGHLVVTPTRGPERGNRYALWTSVRPPEVRDFRQAHSICAAVPMSRGALLCVAAYRGGERRLDSEWLSTQSLLCLADESNLEDLAETIANGNAL